MKLIKMMIFIVPILLQAHSGALANASGAELGFLFFIPILVFFFFLRIFLNTTPIIFALLAILGVLFIIIQIGSYKDRHTPKPRHTYQRPYTYGVYDGNQTAYGTSEKNLSSSSNMTDYYRKKFKSLVKFEMYDNSIYDNEKINYHNPIVLIDTKNKLLRLYEKGRDKALFKTFKVRDRPKLAVYDKNDDKIYAVFDNLKGVYILNNIRKEEYVKIQKQVAHTINILSQPWWRSPKYKSLNIPKNDTKKLEKFLSKHSYRGYIYQVKVIGDRASVVLTLEKNKNFKLKFLLKKQEHWRIKNIFYGDLWKSKVNGTEDTLQSIDIEPYLNKSTEFYYQELKRYIEQFTKESSKYAIFESRIKYGLALKCIEQNLSKEDDIWNITANLRVSALNSITSNASIKKQYQDNIDYLYSNDKYYDFDLVEKMSNYTVEDASDNACQKNMSTTQMYDLFMDRYIKAYERRIKHAYDEQKILKVWHREIVKGYSVYFDKRETIKKKQQEIQRIKNQKIQQEREKVQRVKRKKRALIYEEEKKQRNHKKFLELRRKIKEGISDREKSQLLYMSIYDENLQAIDFLLKNGVDMYRWKIPKFYTPFTSAFDQSKAIEITKIFLRYNVDVNWRYGMSETPLTLAAKGCRNPKLVKLLLDNGADPYVVDEFGFNTVNGLFRYCKKNSNYNEIIVFQS